MDHDVMIAAIESLPARLAGNVAPAIEGIIRTARRATAVDEYEAALCALAGADDLELKLLRLNLRKRFGLVPVKAAGAR